MMRRKHARGQSLVEFAIILPVFITMLVGVFDFGHVVWANNAVGTAAREAARFAIVHGGSDTTDCPVGPASPDAFVPGASADCPYPSPSKQSIKDEAEKWLSGVGGSPAISVCYGNVTTCSGDVDESGATNERGTSVTVTVKASVNLAAPSLFGFGGFDVSGTTTMLVNH
jgi:Flp pilus assembly protein TadG